MGWTAVCAGGRRPAREIAAREPSARSRRSRSPARPCRRPPAPRPGSAGHAGLAVPSMREPAARSRRSRSPARPCRRPPAPSTPVGLFIAVHIPSRPRRPRAPPPSSTARPLLSRSSRVALHTGGAWCAGGDRRRFKARLCPAAAHRHLGPAPRATRASRFPPCVNLRLGVVDLEARPSPPVPSTPVGLFIAVHIPSRPRRPPALRPGSAGLAVPSTKGGAWCAGG